MPANEAAKRSRSANGQNLEAMPVDGGDEAAEAAEDEEIDVAMALRELLRGQRKTNRTLEGFKQTAEKLDVRMEAVEQSSAAATTEINTLARRVDLRMEAIEKSSTTATTEITTLSKRVQSLEARSSATPNRGSTPGPHQGPLPGSAWASRPPSFSGSTGSRLSLCTKRWRIETRGT